MSEKDYTNAPISLGEHRADRDCDASQWTPRECLVQLLRQIDSGQINVTSCVVIFGTSDPQGEEYFHYSQSSPSFPHMLGSLEITKARMIMDAL